MLNKFFEPGPWFRPKMFGYGAGLPMAWQGWVFIATHIGLILGLVTLIGNKPVPLTLLLIFAGISPLPIYAARTQGGWKWRWGND